MLIERELRFGWSATIRRSEASMKRVREIVAIVAMGGVSACAAAQCEPVWQRYGSQSGVDRTVYGLAMFDEDGAGPSRSVPVAVGEFVLASGFRIPSVARWDGTAWTSMSWPFEERVSTVTTWDADGNGPQAPRLVVGTSGGVHEYRGGSWQRLGPFGSGQVLGVVAWQSAGADRLIAVGSLSGLGGVQVRNVGVWNGASWAPLGAGVNAAVQTVMLWDADGSGPDAAWPVIAGDFTSSGGSSLLRIGVWNGQSWSPLGSGVGAMVRSLCLWDPDGPGPQRELLVAAGSRNAGTASVISMWDGQAWSATIPPVLGDATWVHAFDHDADPSTADQLLLSSDSALTTGEVVGRCLLWEGTEWRSIGTAMEGGIRCGVTMEADEGGGVHPELLVGGAFASIDQRRFDRIAAWRGNGWNRLGVGPNGRVLSLLDWDPDGGGPRDSVLAVAGTFTAVGRSAGAYTAAWNGSAWTDDLGSASSTMSNLAIWDPDQSGELPPSIIGSLWFTSPNGTTSSRMVRWTGTSWDQMGTYRGQTAITAVGPSPQLTGPNLLYMASQGGQFPISRFNGTDWVQAFSGLGTTVVNSVAYGDPDGDGPWRAGLVFCGTGVYRATGIDVTAVPGAPLGILCSGIFDVDGDGPLRPSLVVAGAFTGGISVYQNNSWTVIGGGLSGGNSPVVYALERWDPDGPGPAGDLLVAAGRFTRAGGSPARSLAAWDGSNWRSLVGGVGGTVYAMRAFERGGSTDLAIAGEFVEVDGAPTASIAFLKQARFCCPPDFNADGSLNFFDYTDFVACFEGSACPNNDPLAADFNADGFVDFFDYSDFVAAFETGC
jgi:trimeric autotransporter adhesin